MFYGCLILDKPFQAGNIIFIVIDIAASDYVSRMYNENCILNVCATDGIGKNLLKLIFKFKSVFVCLIDAKYLQLIEYGRKWKNAIHVNLYIFYS